MNEFRFTQAEDLFKLFGNINEYSNFGGLFDHHYSHIRFDMEGVGTINSSGVRSWVENIKEFDGKVTFIHCPVTVVDQFNMIPEFMGRDPWVESFYGLFFSPNSNYEETILLEMDKNFDPRSCEFLDSIICPLDNTEMEPDFDTEEYFLFLGQIVESMDKKNEAALENELEIKKDSFTRF